MKTKMPVLFALLLVAAFAAPTALYADATITIVNADGANEGFNDPTLAAPVGGNPGTTRGQQRLIAFQYAADLWAAKIDSNVQIFVIAAFNPLGANVLGSAGTTFVFRDFPGSGLLFPGSEFPATWYHSALTDKRYGADGAPGFADISATFSSNFNFYLGLDNNHGALNDLVAVVLHELAHGLGFANFVNEATGSNFVSQGIAYTDIYSHFTLDETSGRLWSDMPADSSGNAERAASAINIRRVSWNGAAVTAAVPGVLSLGAPRMVVNSPTAIARTYEVGPASFGNPLGSPGVTGPVTLVNDGIAAAGGGTINDACEALPAGSLTGQIGLADRGLCGFIVKVKNIQDAGGIAALIADNVAGAPPAGLGGVDPAITIPSVRISLADGNTLKGNLTGLNVTLDLDMTQRAGASAAGRALLWAVQPVALGSSISHWDVIASRNQLMEPAINPDLTHSVVPPEDLTRPLLRDIGWFPDADFDGLNDETDACLGSDLSSTVVIDGCNSNAPNLLFTSGCTISDFVANCAESAGNHGQFVACVSSLTNDLKKAGLLTSAQKDGIRVCAESADLP